MLPEGARNKCPGRRIPGTFSLAACTVLPKQYSQRVIRIRAAALRSYRERISESIRRRVYNQSRYCVALHKKHLKHSNYQNRRINSDTLRNTDSTLLEDAKVPRIEDQFPHKPVHPSTLLHSTPVLHCHGSPCGYSSAPPVTLPIKPPPPFCPPFIYLPVITKRRHLQIFPNPSSTLSHESITPPRLSKYPILSNRPQSTINVERERSALLD